jgi:hypothetical protein
MKFTKIAIVCLLILVVVAFASISFADTDSVIVPAGYMADTTTPFAIYFASWTTQCTGPSLATTKVRLQIPSGTINTLTNAYTWDTSTSTPSWIGDSQAWANTHTLPISLNTASGWLVAKSVGTAVGMSTCVVRFRAGTSSNTDAYSKPLLMAWDATMAGWLVDTCTFGANIVVLAKDIGGNILGSYITEDNAINEGYSTTPGYVKMAVPVGQVATIEYRDLNNNVIGTKTGPWNITAGAETYTPVKLSRFEATVIH